MADVLYYGSSTQVHSGAAQWMFRMADRMREYGHEVTAILPSGENGIGERYDNNDIKTVEFWSEPLRRRRSFLGHIRYVLFGFIALFRLAIFIRRNNIDIVHVNDVRFFPGLMAGKLGGAKCVCHVRANYESRFFRQMLSSLVVSLSDQVLCVSKRTREIMFEEVRFSTNNVEVLYDCVPEPERFEDTDGSSFRDKFDIGPEEIVVMQVSKLTKNKAQDRLLDAAEEVTKSAENVVFVVVGGNVEGHEEYAKTIRDRAKNMNQVHLAGFVPDVTEALAASDVTVHVPRHDDPFPGVVLEGMLAGNPVIGSRSGGIPEQVDEGESGYLIPKNDGKEDLTKYINYLSENDNEREDMGAKAAQLCKENFPPSSFFNRLDEIYAEVLSGK